MGFYHHVRCTETGVTIGKQASTVQRNTDGAELKLTYRKDADLSKVKASYGDDSVAAIQVRTTPSHGFLTQPRAETSLT